MNVIEVELPVTVVDGLIMCSMPDPKGFRYWGEHYKSDFTVIRAYVRMTCENAIDRGMISDYGLKRLVESIQSMKKYYA